jgi:hypothetical protein
MAIVTRDTELPHFAQWGYLRIPDALPPALVQRVEDAIWTGLERQDGCLREDPSTWRLGQGVLNKKPVDAYAGVEIGARLTGAVNQLLGAGRWRPLKTLGGILLTWPEGRPEEWGLPSGGWHVDNDPRRYRERVDELMLFTFYSSVGPRGGGTLILSGSHTLLERYFAAQKGGVAPESAQLMEGLPAWHPWLAELMGREPMRNRTAEEWMEREADVHGVTVHVVELTGEPGDAVLCHPGILHAGSRNCRPTPRIMRRTNVRRAR